MQPSEAQLTLAQRVMDRAENQAGKNRALAAREAVAARPIVVPDLHAVAEPGEELAEYISSLAARPEYHPFAVEGWSVKVVDLRKVIAVQSVVFWDDAADRTRDIDALDPVSIARLTLPIQESPDCLPVQFDPNRQTWMTSSPNANLRLLAPFSGPVEVNGQKAFGYGFVVAVTPSIVQVVRFRNTLLLRDGYHRCLGLLARGITHAPVMYREFGHFEPLGFGSGMLQEEAYLGERPPYLLDYLDATVAAEVDQPASRNMILIQGLELKTMG